MDTELLPPETRIFNIVKRAPELAEVLNRHGFSAPKPYDRVLNPREWLKFEHPGWFLPRGERVDTVYLYFASMRRGDFRICVDIDPHRVGRALQDDPVRQRERVEQLDEKARLLAEVRRRLLADNTLGRHVTFSGKNLRDPQKPSTVTAIKFRLGLDAEASPTEIAGSIAAVVDRVTPAVNRVLRTWRSGASAADR